MALFEIPPGQVKIFQHIIPPTPLNPVIQGRKPRYRFPLSPRSSAMPRQARCDTSTSRLKQHLRTAFRLQNPPENC